MMLLSYTIYFGLLLICIICSHYAEQKNSRLLMLIIVLSLTTVAALRGFSVGIDTQSYVEKFSYIYNGKFRYAYGFEQTFKYICYALLHVVPNMSFLLGTLAFITHSCIVFRFWELRRVASFTCMVAIYFMSFYFMTFNGIRQFVAVAIVFWGTRYLERKKPLQFIICVCAATLFHQTAIICIFLLCFDLLRWKELHRYQRDLYVVIAFSFPVILALLSMELDQYSQYFSKVTLNIGLVIPVKIALLLLSWFLITHSPKYRKFFAEATNSERFSIRTSNINYLLGLLLAALAYFFPTFIERVSWYFYIYEGVCYGSVLKNTERGTKIPLATMIFFLISYGFLYSMINNSQGTMPYLPI